MFVMQAETEETYCNQGHRSSLILQTNQGGSICLICLSNLLCNSTSLSVHVSYALSQLKQAMLEPLFLQNLRNFHSHLLISPLVQAISSYDDDALASQAIDLVSELCNSNDPEVSMSFVGRITDLISSGALTWNRRQIHILHCLGTVLQSHDVDTTTYIRNRSTLISNLVVGLQLPSEEIRGEILFVLYKLFMHWDDVFAYADLLNHSLEILMKTQSDDVRLNCLALLNVLVQKGFFENSFSEECVRDKSTQADNFVLENEPMKSTLMLFTEAVKGPLLSSDIQVQLSSLDLIFHVLEMSVSTSLHQAQILVEQDIVDYVFEVLRSSGNKDSLVVSCIRVLDLLSNAEENFTQRLAIGFPTLVPVLKYVAEISLHSVQYHTLKLVWACISGCPGVISRSQVEELVAIIAGLFKRHAMGDIGMPSDTFTLTCSLMASLIKTPSSHGIMTMFVSVQEILRDAVLSSLCVPCRNGTQIMYSLYLLKEVHAYINEDNGNLNNVELANTIIEICEIHILPWLEKLMDDEIEEKTVLGVLEIFHLVLIQDCPIRTKKFAEHLASSSWFSFSFGCLGLFPSEQMKLRVYLIVSSIIDEILGKELGQSIRDAALFLPSDPIELLLVLGQKSRDNEDLISCQVACLSILYSSSLYNDSFAEEKHVLASLEQYILVNGDNLLHGISDSKILTLLAHLYGIARGSKSNLQSLYSTEAEKLFLNLLVQKGLDLLSIRIHPTALKWLFKKDQILEILSTQILNFSRAYEMTNKQISSSSTQIIDVNEIAELILEEDSFARSILISLIFQLQENGAEDDIHSILYLIINVLIIRPESSDRLCLQGINKSIKRLYYSSYASTHIYTACSILVFNILLFVHPQELLDNEDWLSTTTKLLEVFTPSLATKSCEPEDHLIMGILSLILHHSTKQKLQNASKVIILNTSLASAVSNFVCTSSRKGHTLIQYQETCTEETLVDVLLLYFFCLKSLPFLLPGDLDWQDFLHDTQSQSLTIIQIPCHDLCRLLYFGSSLIKLIASQCLVEILTRITYQTTTKREELRCSRKYLRSIVGVLEGLVFHEDIRVAINCSMCLSMVLGWVDSGFLEKKAIDDNKWCRVIIEELALSLAAPGMASKSFTNQHKPMSHVAIALLRWEQVPEWMKSVFDFSYISCIIENIAPSNVTPEMVRLFRQLRTRGYLKEDHIAIINRLFQVCRKRLYMQSSQEDYQQNLKKKKKGISSIDDIGQVRWLLIELISPSSFDSNEIQSETNMLLEEIELFLQESSNKEL